MGRGAQLRRTRRVRRARAGARERRTLDSRVSLRRVQARRDAADLRLRPTIMCSPRSSRRARRAAGGRAASSSSPRTRRRTRGWCAPRRRGGYGLDALYNDDFHHSARVALTGVREAYYSDYRGTSQELAVGGEARVPLPGAAISRGRARTEGRRRSICRRASSSAFSRITIRSPIRRRDSGCASCRRPANCAR